MNGKSKGLAIVLVSLAAGAIATAVFANPKNRETVRLGIAGLVKKKLSSK